MHILDLHFHLYLRQLDRCNRGWTFHNVVITFGPTLMYKRYKSYYPIINSVIILSYSDNHVLVTIPPFSIKYLLPKFPDRYYRYHDSLTTPNCNQAVIWSVFDQPQYVSERQVCNHVFSY